MTKTRSDVVKKVNETLENLDDPVFRANIASKLSNDARFLLDPELYANGAIRTLKSQLETVRSAKRKQRLEAKLAHWELALKVLTEDEDGG